ILIPQLPAPSIPATAPPDLRPLPAALRPHFSFRSGPPSYHTTPSLLHAAPASNPLSGWQTLFASEKTTGSRGPFLHPATKAGYFDPVTYGHAPLCIRVDIPPR